jgi:plasmid segregation protein ParM
MYIVGADGGYGYFKAVTADRRVIEPSAIAPARAIKYQSDLASNGRGLTLEQDGETWFVGQLAQLQASEPISPRARNRSMRVIQILALSALYRLGIRQERVQMVTGLPVAWYDDREKIKAALVGTHHYAINGEPCTVMIEDVLVVPQPFGSFFRMLLTPQGVLLDESGLRRERVAVIDIGTYTSDYALADQIHYVEEGSGSIPHAMARVYDLLQDRVAQRYGRELSFEEAEEAARTGYFTDRGERVYVGDLLSEVLDGVAERVVGEAQTLWGEGRDVAAVLVTGGGGAMMMNHVREVYPHAQLVPSPQMANAAGFYRYGLRKFA